MKYLHRMSTRLASFRRELSSAMQRLARPQLLAGGVLTCAGGLGLVALSTRIWITAAGFLLLTVGSMALVAALRSVSRTTEVNRRLLLAIVPFGVLTLGLALLWLRHSPADAMLTTRTPAPGAPLVISGMTKEGKARPGEDEAPLEASLGAFEVAEIESPVLPGVRPAARKFIVGLPVMAQNCRQLEVLLGGTCGTSDSRALQNIESLEVRTLRRSKPLTAELHLGDSRSLQFTDATSPQQQTVPTSWGMQEDGRRTRVDLHCQDGTPIGLRASRQKARAICSSLGPVFWLAFVADKQFLSSIFLNELSEFHTHWKVHRARVMLEGGALTVAGSDKGLPRGPATIAMRSAARDQIDVDMTQSTATGLNNISLATGGAASVTINGSEQVPNWLHQHPEFAYFALAILAAMLLPVLFDFAVARLGKEGAHG